MICRACGREHDPMMTCSRARLLQTAATAQKLLTKRVTVTANVSPPGRAEVPAGADSWTEARIRQIVREEIALIRKPKSGAERVREYRARKKAAQAA